MKKLMVFALLKDNWKLLSVLMFTHSLFVYMEETIIYC